LTKKDSTPSTSLFTPQTEDDFTEVEVYKDEILFSPNPGPQTAFLSASEQEVLYGGPLELGTGVVTNKGVRPIETLEVGDFVLTPKGEFSPVVSIPFVGEELSFELTFSNGSKVVASAGHKWCVGTGDWGKTSQPFRTKITQDLLDFKLSRGRNKYFIPSVSPFKGEEKNFYISPYTLGVLLADGCMTKSLSIFSEDSEIVERVRGELHSDYELIFSGGVTYRLVKKSRNKGLPSEYREELKRLGLFGKGAFDKSVPKDYLFSSVEQRIALLRGLMDSDGTVRKFDGKRRAPELKYTTVSEFLKNDVVFLAHSLGYNTTVYTETLSSGSLVYRVLLTGDLCPFHLSRKAETFHKFSPKAANNIYITDIKPVGNKRVMCIEIEDKDHLFVLGGFITTHNSAGGGKSFGLLADAVRDLPHPNFQGLIVRRTTEELRELVQKSQELYPKAIPGIKWSERKMEWRAPSGGRLWMSYLERDQDLLRYQGQAFSYIAFDELTQWPTPDAWNYMRSRLRSTTPGMKTYMRATTNPGGPGHRWVKSMFIDPAPAGEAFWATDLETGEIMRYPKLRKVGAKMEEHPKAGQPLFKRRFIPAALYDNPYLTADGAYEANLLGLPEMERKKLLEGNWDIIEGAAFPEWNRNIHVVEPFNIPHEWPKFRCGDYGYSDASSVLWIAEHPSGQLIVYRELYQKKILATDLADQIMEAEDGERILYGVLDSSVWRKVGDTDLSLAEQMNVKGCRWRPSDRSKGSRLAGKQEVHKRLQVDEFTGEPRLVIFSTCTNLIAHLPTLPLDKNNPEDVDTKADDHDYDALRYGLRTRPLKLGWEDSFNMTKRFQPADSVFGY
jgi:intein/homing endonuclease